MRGVRIRELRLLVVIAALGLGWGIDRAQMAVRLAGCRRDTASARRSADASAADLERAMGRFAVEMARRKDAEESAEALRHLLAECEGRAEAQ